MGLERLCHDFIKKKNFIDLIPYLYLNCQGKLREELRAKSISRTKMDMRI